MCSLEFQLKHLIFTDRKSRGFTLIELMIVVAIIGILAAVALPSYRSYIIKSKRNAVQAYMLDLTNREKQYLLDARVYTNSKTSLGISSDPNEVASSYTVTIENVTATPPSFTVKATPFGNQSVDGVLTLDNTGQKLPANKW